MIKSIFLTTVCLFSTNLIAMDGYDNDFDPRNQGMQDQNVRAAQEKEEKGQKYWEEPVVDSKGEEMYQLGLNYYGAPAANKAQKKKNIQIARDYFSRAAKLKHADATMYLGKIWQQGTAGETDLFEAEEFYNQAIHLYENLAAEGDQRARVEVRNAKYYLANLYLEGGAKVKNALHPGKAFEANIDDAIKLYKDLADRDGSITAAYMLARTYYKIQHNADAIKYFKIVSNSPTAEKVLGREVLGQVKVALANLYRLNQDVPIDKSLNLYDQARELGNKNAEKHINYIGRQQNKTKQAGNGEHSYEALASY